MVEWCLKRVDTCRAWRSVESVGNRGRVERVGTCRACRREK